MNIATDDSDSGVLHGEQGTMPFAVGGDSQPPPGFTRNAQWRLRAGFSSVTGLRSANEDCGYVNVHDGLFFVADGVGGQFGGDVASQLLVDTIPPLLVPTVRDSDVKDDELGEAIRQSVCATQKAMKELAIREPDLAQMGSTIALGVIAGQKLYATHLGDSRIYLVRHGTVKQLTKDHSVVQNLIDAGIVTPLEAKQHPWHNIITESVSAERQSPVDVAVHELLPGDRLLFATDGLTDVIEDELLGWMITNLANPQLAADALVRQALDSGSRDNVTCLVVDAHPAQGRVFQRRRWFARK